MGALEDGADRYDLVCSTIPCRVRQVHSLRLMRERGYPVPVVSTSGYAKDPRGAPQWQPDAFLPKPFTLAKLNAALRKALGDFGRART